MHCASAAPGRGSLALRGMAQVAHRYSESLAPLAGCAKILRVDLGRLHGGCASWIAECELKRATAEVPVHGEDASGTKMLLGKFPVEFKDSDGTRFFVIFFVPVVGIIIGIEFLVAKSRRVKRWMKSLGSSPNEKTAK